MCKQIKCVNNVVSVYCPQDNSAPDLGHNQRSIIITWMAQCVNSKELIKCYINKPKNDDKNILHKSQIVFSYDFSRYLICFKIPNSVRCVIDI